MPSKHWQASAPTQIVESSSVQLETKDQNEIIVPMARSHCSRRCKFITFVLTVLTGMGVAAVVVFMPQIKKFFKIE